MKILNEPFPGESSKPFRHCCVVVQDRAQREHLIEMIPYASTSRINRRNDTINCICSEKTANLGANCKQKKNGAEKERQ